MRFTSERTSAFLRMLQRIEFLCVQRLERNLEQAVPCADCACSMRRCFATSRHLRDVLEKEAPNARAAQPLLSECAEACGIAAEQLIACITHETSTNGAGHATLFRDCEAFARYLLAGALAREH